MSRLAAIRLRAARAMADASHDHLFKLPLNLFSSPKSLKELRLIIGDSGVGKSSILLRF